MNNFTNKKIGIWGFGIVGRSALTYFDQFNCTHIEILNSTAIESLPTTNNKINTSIQDSSTIQDFLDSNDFILASPGIKLHAYQDYHHKFISELDIFQENNRLKTIGITGSLGKTTITHILTNILQKMSDTTIAAGNIGLPMLDIITQPQYSKLNLKKIILELSSFQLQQTQTFSPDFAIITNLYENHLDYHKDMNEYINSKCNILKHQTENQTALLPIELLSHLQQKGAIKTNWIFFSSKKLTQQELEELTNQTIYYLDDKIIYKKQFDTITQIFNISQFPAITFDTNWLIIIATLDLQKILLTQLNSIINDLDKPEHRLQKIATLNDSDFFNDSKSTVWQATLQAVNAMDSKPIKLFLGGLSKGADRTPLIESLQNKNVEIYAFGKEAQLVYNLCKQFKIPCNVHTTLEESFNNSIDTISQPSNILFSPGGSSFDLFDNYIKRGQYFSNLVNNLSK